MDQSPVIAVIVTYQPDLSVLGKLLALVCPQVKSVVVVDNGSNGDVEQWLQGHFAGRVNIITLSYNYGIAYAQNRGIDWARQQGAEAVLLLDQDSEPQSDMVAVMVRARQSLVAAGHLVACLGPCYVDERQDNPPPFIRMRGLRLEHCPCLTTSAIVPVDYLISSGCLIPMSVLDQVGAMRENLFIDYVDIEWGMRAQHFGFQSFGVCGARMKHSLGSAPIEFFGKKIPLHSPLRHYYHFRNALLLCREPWLTRNWKVANTWRLVLKYIFYGMFASPRLQQWQMMSLGVWHGIIGRTGKLARD